MYCLHTFSFRFEEEEQNLEIKNTQDKLKKCNEMKTEILYQQERERQEKEYNKFKSEGEYYLYVEAARELGGREMLRLPLSLPLNHPISITDSGEHELGRVSLKLEP